MIKNKILLPKINRYFIKNKISISDIQKFLKEKGFSIKKQNRKIKNWNCSLAPVMLNCRPNKGNSVPKPKIIKSAETSEKPRSLSR